MTALFATMTLADWIQIGVLLTATLALGLAARQTYLQNRLMKAQLLRDRFEMYWQVYNPVSAEQVAELKLYPDEYMGLARFKDSYEGNDAAITKYIYMSLLYEFLAFSHAAQYRLKVPDPLGKDWLVNYASELIASSQFQDVHEEYRGYYRDFADFIDGLMLSKRVTNGDFNEPLKGIRSPERRKSIRPKRADRRRRT
jgi:hypothetical protein